MKTEIRSVLVTRYMQPLREGGSLPALAEADDGFKYVVKFRGGGHGVKALIAELIGGLIAKELDLKVPEIVFAELDESFGITEGDEEIQDLLKASKSTNIGLHFLSGAFAFDAAVNKVDALLASKIVWLDSFIMNVDRTFRNTNMLIWNKDLWLIDHGSSLYFQYNWDTWREKATGPFAYIKDHVLLPSAKMLTEVNEFCRTRITEQVIDEIASLIPDNWLQWEDRTESEQELREVYANFLKLRLTHSTQFIQEAENAAKTLI